MRRRFRVQRRGGQWLVLDSEGGTTPKWTKREAVGLARRLAREHRAAGHLAQVVVRRANGQFHYEHTYGRDPRRRKG